MTDSEKPVVLRPLSRFVLAYDTPIEPPEKVIASRYSIYVFLKLALIPYYNPTSAAKTAMAW